MLRHKRYRREEIAAFFDHAHNDYVQFLTDTGAIGRNRGQSQNPESGSE